MHDAFAASLARPGTKPGRGRPARYLESQTGAHQDSRPRRSPRRNTRKESHRLRRIVRFRRTRTKVSRSREFFANRKAKILTLKIHTLKIHPTPPADTRALRVPSKPAPNYASTSSSQTALDCGTRRISSAEIPGIEGGEVMSVIERAMNGKTALHRVARCRFCSPCHCRIAEQRVYGDGQRKIDPIVKKEEKRKRTRRFRSRPISGSRLDS
jgi:hypothetical protein